MAIQSVKPAAAKAALPDLQVAIGNNCPITLGGDLDDRYDDVTLFGRHALAIVEAVQHAGDNLDNKRRANALDGAINLLELALAAAASTDPRSDGGEA